MLKVHKEKQRDLGIKSAGCLGSVQITGGGKGYCALRVYDWAKSVAKSSLITRKSYFLCDNISFKKGEAN